MLVKLRPASAPAKVCHALHLPDPLVDHSGNRVGRFQRCAWRQENIHLHASLVERRQEVAAEVGCDPQAHRHRRGNHQQDRDRMPHAQPNRPTGECLEPAEQESVLLVLVKKSGGKQPVGEHWGDCQRDQQRCQDRDNVGDPQRGEQFPLHPLQSKQRHENEHHEDRAEDDRVAHLAAGFIHHSQRRFRLRELIVFAEAPKNVFDVDDCIVDQFADRHRQSAERHRIDRHSQPMKHQSRDHDR